MKAVIYHLWTAGCAADHRGSKPTPKNNEVLIRVHAAAVTTTDCNLRGGDLMRLVFGLRKPKRSVLGTEFAGEIEAVGKDVQHYRVGDQVFAATGAGSVRMPSTSVCRRMGRWHRNRRTPPMRKPPPSARGD